MFELGFPPAAPALRARMGQFDNRLSDRNGASDAFAMSRISTSNVVTFSDIILRLARKAGEVALLYRKHLAQPDPDPLRRFDLTESEILERVIRPAVNESDSTHPLAPPGSSGQRMYQANVASLREVLLPRKWKKDDTDGVARTVHAERGLAIIVAAGNEFTGVPETDEYFTTKWPKGSCALTGVRYVAEGFDAIDETFPASPNVKGVWEVWYLVHHRVEDEVRVEISKPGRLDGRDHPCDWIERIILNPLKLNPEVDIHPDSDDDDQGGPEVPVVLK